MLIETLECGGRVCRLLTGEKVPERSKKAVITGLILAPNKCSFLSGFVALLRVILLRRCGPATRPCIADFEHAECASRIGQYIFEVLECWLGGWRGFGQAHL